MTSSQREGSAAASTAPRSDFSVGNGTPSAAQPPLPRSLSLRFAPSRQAVCYLVLLSLGSGVVGGWGAPALFRLIAERNGPHHEPIAIVSQSSNAPRNQNSGTGSIPVTPATDNEESRRVKAAVDSQLKELTEALRKLHVVVDAAQNQPPPQLSKIQKESLLDSCETINGIITQAFGSGRSDKKAVIEPEDLAKLRDQVNQLKSLVKDLHAPG